MKMTDLRAKARAIFGSANPEPMPNQPNGAKALQQRANARPIPTYKVGGVVKKADGGAMKPKLSTAERKMGDALMMTRKGKEVMAAQKQMEADKEKAMAAKRDKADKLLGITKKKDGGVMADRIAARMAAGNYKKGGKVQTSADTARKLATEMGGMKKGGKSKAKDGLAVMIAIGSPKKPAKKAIGGKMMEKMGPAITRAKADLDRMAAMPKVDPRDIKGRPGGGMLGKMMRNPEMRAKFEAAAEKAGVPAPRTAIGYPVRSNPVAKVQYKDGGTPVKKAVGGAGKTRKGQAPIKKAQGGAAKVRKGMMSPTGDIKQVVTPKKGIGGM